jgi:hypothetical protein
MAGGEALDKLIVPPEKPAEPAGSEESGHFQSHGKMRFITKNKGDLVGI